MMGRWAQAQRRGGGGTATSQVLVQILSAAITDTTKAEITYSADVTAATFDESSFESDPSLETGSSIAQVDGNTIEVTFSGDISSDTGVNYDGDTPGILTPDSASYT